MKVLIPVIKKTTSTGAVLKVVRVDHRTSKFIEFAQKKISGFEVRENQIRAVNALLSLSTGDGKTMLIDLLKEFDKSTQ